MNEYTDIIVIAVPHQREAKSYTWTNRAEYEQALLGEAFNSDTTRRDEYSNDLEWAEAVAYDDLHTHYVLTVEDATKMLLRGGATGHQAHKVNALLSDALDRVLREYDPSESIRGETENEQGYLDPTYNWEVDRWHISDAVDVLRVYNNGDISVIEVCDPDTPTADMLRQWDAEYIAEFAEEGLLNANE